MSPEIEQSIQIILEVMYQELYNADIHGRIDPDTLNVLAHGIIDIRKLLNIEGE